MTPPRLQHRLADLMADGCPTLVDAAYRLRRPLPEIETLWRAIVRALGRQAR